MSTFTLKVLLVIPLYNHAGTVGKVVEAALRTGRSVLVVDDGSDDGGAEGLDGLGIFLVRLPENRGKGAAINTALKFALEKGYDAIVTLDADGQHNPVEANILVEEAQRAKRPTIVIGNRRMDGENVPGSSLFGRKFSNFWVRLECGLDLPDTQSGMRLYPVAEMSRLRTRTVNYDYEIEALVRAVWGGVAVRSVDISVHYPPPGERVSHFHKFRDNLRLSLLHSRLVTRRLFPMPHQKLVEQAPVEEPILVKGNPIKTLKNLCLESSSPFWLATAVWVGIFLGALPLIACHTVAIIYVTYRLRLNKVAAVAASQFCMPPLVPALCIEAGHFLRYGTFLLDVSWERWVTEIHLRLWEWLLGSLIVGPLLGLLGAVPVYWFANFVRNRSRTRAAGGVSRESDRG